MEYFFSILSGFKGLFFGGIYGGPIARFRFFAGENLIKGFHFGAFSSILSGFKRLLFGGIYGGPIERFRFFAGEDVRKSFQGKTDAVSQFPIWRGSKVQKFLTP